MKKFSQMKFKKPDLARIERDFDAIIDEFNSAECFEDQNAALKKMFKYSDSLNTNFSIGYAKYTCDILDEENVKNKELIDEIGPEIDIFVDRFNKALVNARFKDELKAKWGKHLFNMAYTKMETFDEKIVPELQEINRLGSEYTKLIASAKIEFRGEIYNLPQMGKFTTSIDRKTRKEATVAYCRFFEENFDALGEIYDKLVKTRHAMAQKLGYENFIELGYKSLGRTDYNSEDVRAYREQIYTDLVPLTNKLFKDQAKRLKIRNPQSYDYNINFLSGNATPKGDRDYLVEQATRMYAELSDETNVFFEFMKEYELLDLEARKGKVGGGYMTYFPDYKAPFIFSNFNGTSADVDVLTHEFGHAFQGYMSRNISCPDYRSPTLEACEMHSMSMEFITYPWMEYFFNEEANKYRYSHVCDGLTFIPYGVAVDEFQHFVYENPEITHEERCAKWREIEKKYLPHIKYDNTPILEKGGYWLRQYHIFESPFYYIDYTLAQIVAFQFFNEARRDHTKAWKKYVKLCKMGGKYPFTELLERAHLNNPFVSGTVKKVVKPLKKYLKEFDTSKF
ncbi:MAG: M3 family oligoendopeptidase [Clostridia bacterium]|nr:M3 family oligoendopeptidase [Clostridia bacterium]